MLSYIPTALFWIIPCLALLTSFRIAKIVIAYRYSAIQPANKWSLGILIKTVPIDHTITNWIGNQTENIVVDYTGIQKNNLTGFERYIAFDSPQALIRYTGAMEQPILTLGLAESTSGSLQFRVSIISIVTYILSSIFTSFAFIFVLVMIVTFAFRAVNLTFLNPWVFGLLWVIRMLWLGAKFVNQEMDRIQEYLEHESRN